MVNSGSSPAFVAFGENMATNFNLATAAGSAGYRPVINMKRSRGTLAAPGAVVNDDFLSSFVSSGYDGSAFQNPVSIDVYVDGTPSAGNVPARISLVTGSNQSNRLERLKIGNTGDFNFNNGQVFLQQSTGFLGIGTASPSYQLNVSAISTAIYGSSISGIGVYGNTAYNVGDGVHGYASGNLGYGLYGESVSAYGLFAYTQNASSFAGYFAGKVYSSGGFTSSDRKLKQDIKDVSNAMDIISKLKPKFYTFRQDGDYRYMNLPTGTHYGLIAQDVEQVLPNLVSEAQFDAGRVAGDHPAVARQVAGNNLVEAGQGNAKDENDRVISFKAMNYTELTPIMIKAIQEQQEMIEKQQKQNDAQQKEIDDLKQMVKDLLANKEVSAGGAKVTLEQNIPNPLDNLTHIRYAVPQETKNVQLLISDITGKVVKQQALTVSANGDVPVDASQLASGSYTYSIIVDGKLLQTKKMIVERANNF